MPNLIRVEDQVELPDRLPVVPLRDLVFFPYIVLPLLIGRARSLAALDEELHGEMCRLLERVHRETGVTILHITHSPSEAKRLAGCHFRLADGKVTRDE